jgi:hypothetical protein
VAWLAGEIVTDLTKFPDGMDGTGAWVHNQTFSPSAAAIRRANAVAEFHGLDPRHPSVQANSHFTYWLYTSRGTTQCGTSKYHAPGSQGHEKADAAWMAAAGADGAKIDSCGGVQEPDQAIADYALWRDSFNATGKDMVFSLCGWKPLYSPVGYSLGNLWRISGDGRSWGPLTLAMDHNAYLGQNAGPGGWNGETLCPLALPLDAPPCARQQASKPYDDTLLALFIEIGLTRLGRVSRQNDRLLPRQFQGRTLRACTCWLGADLAATQLSRPVHLAPSRQAHDLPAAVASTD